MLMKNTSLAKRFSGKYLDNKWEVLITSWWLECGGCFFLWKQKKNDIFFFCNGVWKQDETLWWSRTTVRISESRGNNRTKGRRRKTPKPKQFNVFGKNKIQQLFVAALPSISLALLLLYFCSLFHWKMFFFRRIEIFFNYSFHLQQASTWETKNCDEKLGHSPRRRNRQNRNPCLAKTSRRSPLDPTAPSPVFLRLPRMMANFQTRRQNLTKRRPFPVRCIHLFIWGHNGKRDECDESNMYGKRKREC